MLIQGFCEENSMIVRLQQLLIHDHHEERVKLTAKVNARFTHVSGQGATVPTNNVRTFRSMSVSGHLAGCPNGNMITRKIRKPVPEDSSISQEIDGIETGQTEARVSLDAELLSNSSLVDEHERRRSVKSAERIGSVTLAQITAKAT